jgi:hypothetical protein
MWKKGEKDSVLHPSAGSFNFPLDAAIDRLCDAVGVDSKDIHGTSATIHADFNGYYDVVEYLARNKRADLSIVDSDGDHVYNAVDANPDTLKKIKMRCIACWRIMM